MSLLTGDPRGRVVFVSANMVMVYPRDRITHVALDYGSRECAALHTVIDGRPSSWGNFPNEMMWQVYASIVAEDTDVVWTEVEGGWTRTPDDVAERWRSIVPRLRGQALRPGPET